jgi:hypothetical protein
MVSKAVAVKALWGAYRRGRAERESREAQPYIAKSYSYQRRLVRAPKDGELSAYETRRRILVSYEELSPRARRLYDKALKEIEKGQNGLELASFGTT